MEYGISSADKLILREVAKKHKELAAQERNAVLKERPFRGKFPWWCWSHGDSTMRSSPPD